MRSFLHMTVFDNVAFGLKMRKLDKAVIQRDVMQMLKLVDLEGFENRYPREMSGGQRQRVALGTRDGHQAGFDAL